MEFGDAFDLSAEMADQPGGHVFNTGSDPIIDPAEVIVTDPPVDPIPGDPAPNADNPPVKSWFDDAKPVFAELLEEEPESIDALKTKISTERTELKELREKAKQFNPELVTTINDRIKQLELENEELMKDIDPMSHFTSEQAYRSEQLKRKFPDKNPHALDLIMNNDIAKLSPVDVIRLNLAFDYGVTNPDQQDKWIEKKYGVDLSDEEADMDIMMQTDAVDIGRRLQAVKQTEIPQVKDYKTIKEQKLAEVTQKQAKLATDWAPIVDKAVTSLKKLTLSFKDSEGKDDPFEFAIDETSLVPYSKRVTEILAKGGKELSEENLSSVMNTVKERLVVENLSKIITSYSNKKLAELDEKWAKETNNPRKINQSQRPPVVETAKANSKEAAEAEIMGWQ